MQPPEPFVPWTPGKVWHNDSYDAINPSRPELSSKGKNIVVTGGGYGIGKEVVRSFATAGASTISILGRKEAPLKETKAAVEKEFKGTRIEYYLADVTSETQMKNAASRIGKWDVLIMNAGYLSKPEATETAEWKEWWASFEASV
jgi:NAD(P)-dependent dehydrogenase (short-subunit alcohol dehydrogenase family)